MQVQYLTSACVKIIHDKTTILCDPWLIDGEYYGSWAHYPPFDFNPKNFDDIDYIYISHQHPDHFSIKTLSKLNKKIPVYIHSYHYKFLKPQIENLGFSVTELNHNERIRLKNDLFINILAADNCNPELCYKFFGCGIKNKQSGSTYNDTMCVIDDGTHVIVNTNDCPFPLAETTTNLVKSQYEKIDLLLVGYNSASPFPQCFDIEKNQIESEKLRVIKKFFAYAESYINLLKPKFFLPFAGRYVLAGKNHILNSNRAAVELEDAYDHFINSKKIDQKLSKCIILNTNAVFDLDTSQSNISYTPIDKNAKFHYIENVLSEIKYDYEINEFPNLNQIEKFLDKSYEHFEIARKELQFSTKTNVLIKLPEDHYLLLTCDGSGFEIIHKDLITKMKNFVKIDVDSRLLKLLLEGPKYANWNNCEVGSHLKFKRIPEIYESGIFFCLNFFHV